MPLRRSTREPSVLDRLGFPAAKDRKKSQDIVSSIESDTFKEEEPLKSKSAADDDLFKEVDERPILPLVDNTPALYPSLPSSPLLTL